MNINKIENSLDINENYQIKNEKNYYNHKEKLLIFGDDRKGWQEDEEKYIAAESLKSS